MGFYAKGFGGRIDDAAAGCCCFDDHRLMIPSHGFWRIQQRLSNLNDGSPGRKFT
jgi:hypothetical protein